MGNKTLMPRLKEFFAGLKEDFKCFGRYIKYLWIPLIVSAILLLLLHFSIQSNANSVRYMLSALVQSEAAIVAIVITLTLIAVQLTASAYSPRVIDIFIKNRDMKVLFCLYGISIFYGLLLLRYVDEAEGSVVIPSVIMAYGHIPIVLASSESVHSLFEWLTLGALLLGIFSFAALIPYIRNITELLKPSNIMRRLSENVTENTIIKYINKEKNPNDTNISDPLQQIVDIICGVLEKHDFETAGTGLEIIGKPISSVKRMQDTVKISKYSSYFCNHLQRIGTLAAKGEHDEFTKETLKILQCIVEDNYAENGLEEAMKIVAYSLSAIGEVSLRRNLREATKQAACSLGSIGKDSASNGFNDATEQVADYLGTIGKASVSKEVIKQIVRDLTEIGKSAAKNGKKLENALWEVVLSLESVGIAVANRKEHGEVANAVITSLKEIGEGVYIKLKLKDVTWQIAKSMGSIGFVAAEKGKELENITKKAAKSLGELGKNTAAKGKELETVTNEVAKSLGVIGEIVVEKRKRELTEVTKDVVKTHQTLGEAAVDNELEKTGIKLADSLRSIGVTSAEYGVKDITGDVIYALKTLGIKADNKFTDLAWLTVYSLSVVGKSAALNGIKLEEETSQAIFALGIVGKSAPRNIKDVSRAVTEIADIATLKAPNSKIEEAKDQVLKALQ
jgi:hypothetical protein